MVTRVPIQRAKASKIRTNADIVFCIDATGSMDPCIEGVRDGVKSFVDGLQTAAAVDFRLRLLAYRDRHDPRCGTTWVEGEFTQDPDRFKSEVDSLDATGGGDAPESTLDALFLAIRSQWRPVKTHKTIVLLTDADTHPTLHSSTYPRRDNGVERVIQELQTLRHVLVYMVAPRYPTYERIESAMKDAERKVIAKWVPTDDDRYTGLKGVDWQPLMTMIGQMVSVTSIAAAQSS